MESIVVTLPSGEEIVVTAGYHQTGIAHAVSTDHIATDKLLLILADSPGVKSVRKVELNVPR